MRIEQARAVYEDAKIFFAYAGYWIIDLYAGSHDAGTAVRTILQSRGLGT
jgi:hypothetical protein